MARLMRPVHVHLTISKDRRLLPDDLRIQFSTSTSTTRPAQHQNVARAPAHSSPEAHYVGDQVLQRQYPQTPLSSRRRSPARSRPHAAVPTARIQYGTGFGSCPRIRDCADHGYPSVSLIPHAAATVDLLLVLSQAMFGPGAVFRTNAIFCDPFTAGVTVLAHRGHDLCQLSSGLIRWACASHRRRIDHVREWVRRHVQIPNLPGLTPSRWARSAITSLSELQAPALTPGFARLFVLRYLAQAAGVSAGCVGV